MSEEEKAIEYLRKHIIPYNNINGNIEFLVNEIILNLISKLQKENQELKDINVELNTDIGSMQTTIAELKEENKKIDKAADKMYEYISYYGWEDFESNTGCNRYNMVDYFYKE